MKQRIPNIAAVALAAAAIVGTSVPAASQEAPPPPPPDRSVSSDVNCGTWQNGTWIPNGSCQPNDYRSRVAGTITAVKGHLVTVQQTAQTLVINDQPALDAKTSGRVAVGRQIQASGYWRNGTFFATAIH